jgi:hypothetical protein
MILYCISGLGADERMFENLSLPSSIQMHHLPWLEPLENENFKNYCRRLAAPVDYCKEFCLLGLSLGGLAAVEINQFLPAKMVFLVSTISSKAEIPNGLKWIRQTHFHQAVPDAMLRWHNPVVDWFFGATTPREKYLIGEYLKKSSIKYLRWAIHQVLTWQNSERPSNCMHIHGSSDRIFPPNKISADIIVKGGSHLMIHNRPDEISAAISKALEA